MKTFIRILILLILITGCNYNGTNSSASNSSNQEFEPQIRYKEGGLVLVDRLDTIKNLLVFEVFENGQISDQNLAKREYYYRGGQIKNRTLYKNGVENGVYREWNESGTKIIEGTFQKGQKNGEWSMYRQDGSLAITGNYLTDSIHGRWEHYDNGELTQAYTIHLGILDGYDSIWNSTGNLKEVFYYDQGILVDTGYLFYEDQNREVKYIFENGAVKDTIVVE